MRRWQQKSLPQRSTIRSTGSAAGGRPVATEGTPPETSHLPTLVSLAKGESPRGCEAAACGDTTPVMNDPGIDFGQKRTPNPSDDKVVWLERVWRDHLLISAGAPVPPRTRRPLYERGFEVDRIRNVWSKNVEDEFKIIQGLIADYPYIAMDTEFPGIVARPIGEFNTSAAFQYQSLRCNVDLLRLIQLGLTFYDAKGNTPPGPCITWQFNFKFSLNEDLYAEDSIDLLRHSGIQFAKHEADGIAPSKFAELLMTSGIVLMDNITWLSFHSGYDFGYLLKLLTNKRLPDRECEFFDILKTYFPAIYDVKHLMQACNLNGGLQDLAMQLQVERTGTQHQAGSDSLVTGRVFFKLRELYFNGVIDAALYCGHLYGLGPPVPMSTADYEDDLQINDY